MHAGAIRRSRTAYATCKPSGPTRWRFRKSCRRFWWLFISLGVCEITDFSSDQIDTRLQHTDSACLDLIPRTRPSSEPKRDRLEALVRAVPHLQALVVRCASSSGPPTTPPHQTSQIDAEFQLRPHTAAVWRKTPTSSTDGRASGLLPRSDRPRSFSPSQRSDVIAVARQVRMRARPDRDTLELDDWPATLINRDHHDQAIEPLGRSGGWLKDDLKPHRRYWLKQQRSHFDTKGPRPICQLSLKAPAMYQQADWSLLDEKTGMQALGRPAPTQQGPNRPARETRETD